jgi:hypothetical protein
VFAGHLSAVRFEGEKPVEVMFDLLDYHDTPNEALVQLYQWRPSEITARTLAAVELPSDSPERSKRHRGQGRRMDAAKREVVERYGMEVCRKYYARIGFTLVDTSKTRPFDFEARLGNTVRRVEVKGTTGMLGKVVLTSGEVEASLRDNVPTDLVVVHSVELRECGVGTYEGFGGVMHIFRNWIPQDDRLRPIQYEYSVAEEGETVAIEDEPADSTPSALIAKA